LASDYITALQYRAFLFEEFLSTVFFKRPTDVGVADPLSLTLTQTAYNTGPGYLKVVVAFTRATRVINFLRLAVLSVTCGHKSEGAPYLVPLVGHPFSESLLFRLGPRGNEPASRYSERD